MNQVMWHNGVGYRYADDPGEAQVDFAFTEPRFVYAIRLKISYGQHTIWLGGLPYVLGN